MAVYKDKKRGTWYSSIMYKDWTGKQCRKIKRGFVTKKEAQDWEKAFTYREASNLDMKFGDFVKVYEKDQRPKLKENTWLSKEHIIQTKLLPYFENKRMCDIAPRDIVQWQNVMLEGSSKNGTKYAATYLKTLQSQLSCLFNHAVVKYKKKRTSLDAHKTEELEAILRLIQLLSCLFIIKVDWNKHKVTINVQEML